MSRGVIVVTGEVLARASSLVESLLGDKFEIGGEGSAAAGPVGRSASASTDVRLNAQILSYSRSKGAFAGLELKGVVIKPDKEDNLQVYGMTAPRKRRSSPEASATAMG